MTEIERITARYLPTDKGHTAAAMARQRKDAAERTPEQRKAAAAAYDDIFGTDGDGRCPIVGRVAQ